MKTTYIFVKQIHFGGLKFSMGKGTKFDLYESKKDRYVMVNGEKFTELREFDLCIKKEFAIPYVEGETEVDDTIKTMPRKTDKTTKMRIEKSDADEMNEIIDISNTKNENIKKQKEEARKAKASKTAKEEEVKTIRGMKILKSSAKIIGGSEEVGDDIASMVNGDDAKVVATIGNKETEETVAKKETTVAKKGTKTKEMSPEVKARLEARKKQAADGHKKTVAKDKK
jgi:DNA polymerase III gamma/tau subunit